jgi:hypothetical protein
MFVLILNFVYCKLKSSIFVMNYVLLNTGRFQFREILKNNKLTESLKISICFDNYINI